MFSDNLKRFQTIYGVFRQITIISAREQLFETIYIVKGFIATFSDNIQTF